MTSYRVYFTQTISAVVTVEADDPMEAIELAYESDDMPGSMAYGAFGSATVDEAGEWSVCEVADAASDEVVWSE